MCHACTCAHRATNIVWFSIIQIEEKHTYGKICMRESTCFWACTHVLVLSLLHILSSIHRHTLEYFETAMGWPSTQTKTSLFHVCSYARRAGVFFYLFSCPLESTLVAYSKHTIHNHLETNYTDYLISNFLFIQDTIYTAAVLHHLSCNSQWSPVQSHIHLFMISSMSWPAKCTCEFN